MWRAPSVPVAWTCALCKRLVPPAGACGVTRCTPALLTWPYSTRKGGDLLRSRVRLSVCLTAELDLAHGHGVARRGGQ